MQQVLAQRAFVEDIADDRRDPRQPNDRLIGHVVACSGARATIATSGRTTDGVTSEMWSIGRLISILVGTSRIVGMVYEMRTANERWDEGAANLMHIEVELVGEIRDRPQGGQEFSRGIAVYPTLGAIVHRIRHGDLATVFERSGSHVVTIGHLSQDAEILATINADDLLKRHFAIVGTTGTGKSSALSLLVRKTLAVKPNLRVLVLDPHNEFAHAFQDCAAVLDAASLELPFWMFRFDEFEDVVFRGRPPVPEESDILREMIIVARGRYRAEGQPASAPSLLIRKPAGESSGPTADAPTPYRIVDLIKAIDEALGQLDPRHGRHHLTGLKAKLESLVYDPRFRFMFGHVSDHDTMQRVVGTIFRIPQNGRPVCVFQLAGIPSEVVNAVVSVIARMAFELALWGKGNYEVLLVCEEAHRYVPQDATLGFAPTRQAIARIAKEGRKYGASLGIITQRPGELDPTILSQCSTVFAMRLANDRDQEIIRSAIADSSASTISFLSAIGNREAIAFGEAVPTPMRMRFSDQERTQLPATLAEQNHDGAALDEVELRSVIGRLRGASSFDR